MDETERVDNSAGLIAEAAPWIDAHLAAKGLARTGNFGEPRIRTWATVVAIPTTGGTVWFKAASEVTAHEIRLYPLLVRASRDLVLHPIASEPARAWILLPDGGSSLMHAVSGDELVDRLVELVSRYAHLQRSLDYHVPAMLDAGVPDMRPETLADRFDEALAGAMAIAHAAGHARDIDALKRVVALRPRFLAWQDALARGPVTATLDHADLHSNNILVPEGPSGQARIYDWGDSVIAHPFSTLLVLLRALMDQLQTTPEDPRIARVRDAYLAPYSDRGNHAELLHLADAACWTSMVTRALTWMRVLELGPPPNPDWSMAPVEWMKTLLNDSWLD